jgi:hypothetical protein
MQEGVVFPPRLEGGIAQTRCACLGLPLAGGVAEPPNAESALFCSQIQRQQRRGSQAQEAPGSRPVHLKILLYYHG